MKRYVSLLGFLLLALIGRATEISLSSTSGHPGDEVDVTVSLYEPGKASALELDIPLPSGLTFVNESPVSLSSSSHSVTGNVKNGELRIIIHSFSLEILPSGELMKFALRLGKSPGEFVLAPTVILSDGTGTALQGSVTPGIVTVLSPSIELSPLFIDFGKQPIRGTYTRSFDILNPGNETLDVTAIESSADDLVVTTSLPLSIEPGSSASVSFDYSPIKRASEVSEALTVKSNAINGDAKLNISAVPFSVNELHVAEQISGNSDEVVTVLLRLKNMEPICGLQATFTLPEAIAFVEGSQKVLGRASSFNFTSTIDGNKLTLIAYSMSGASMEEGDDNVLTFDLRLNGSSGWYFLAPENVILSNSEMENMTSSTSGQYVVINAPAIIIPSNVDFGNVAVGNEGYSSLSINNSGQAPLTIDRVVLTNDIFSLDSTLPVTIEPYGTASIPFTVAPLMEGRQSAVANIYSNDPESRLKKVNFTVDAFESNQLTLSGKPNDDYTAYVLDIGLDNYSEITALQMDIRWIEGMETSLRDLVMTARCHESHTASVTPMGNGLYRIIIFSFSNIPFTGNEGNLFSLTFHGENFIGTNISAENIILSTASGKNYTSPGSSISVVSVDGIKVTEIALSSSSLEMKEGETTRLSAVVSPSNAEVKTVSWNSSNPEVATVSQEGMVSALSVGETTITVLADDDSGIQAECMISVVPTPAQSITISAEGETTLKAMESVQLKATVLPETTTDKAVCWNSEKPEVASVSDDGLVTAISVGTAIITATNSAGQSDQITITVIPTPVESIFLNQTEVTLKVSESIVLTATILPESSTNKSVLWTSSNSEVAVVSQEGVVTAFSEGDAEISATASDGSGVGAFCKVKVIPTPAESIEIDTPENTTMFVENTLQLTAIIHPSTATDKSIFWQSEYPEIASVDNDGLVFAISSGQTTIYASTSNGLRDQILITVIHQDELDVGFTFSKDETLVDIYDINGLLIKHKVTKEEITTLSPGLYVINGAIFLKR